MVELKFSDVVRRARLNESTAQYVLKSGHLTGTPKAGEKGRHRVFSFGQAFRFALATRLVMAGVPAGVADRVVRFCLTRIDKLARPATGWKDHRRFRPNGVHDWTLEILDDELVRVWRRDLSDRWDHDECYSISRDALAKDVDFPEPIAQHEVDLTVLERELGREV